MGHPVLKGLAPPCVRTFPKSFHPRHKAAPCWPLYPESRINLLVLAAVVVSPVSPPSWWLHDQATNSLTRALSRGHLSGYCLSRVGLGSTQLFLGTVPGWGGSVHLCGFYTNRCNMGAPLAQRKALVGEETWGKHVTYCTRVASPCLETYNITAMNTRICSKHATLRGYACCFYIRVTPSMLHTCGTCELLHIQYS